MIPKYEMFMRPVLEILSDKQTYRNRELHERVAGKDYFNFSEEERNQVLRGGKGYIYKNRANWAITYLFQAGLLERPERGVYKISQQGLEALDDHQEINNSMLSQYTKFNDFLNRSKTTDSDLEKQETKSEIQHRNGETPLEAINSGLDQLDAELAGHLLDEILQKDAYFFESLVVQLLNKMGYGGKTEQFSTTKKSGDEGIDGLISSDRLGLDTIYVQAKRYSSDRMISNGQIRDFSGALLQKGATKGVFITTSDFTEPAKNAVAENRHQMIALINGRQLTSLMIEYNLGVSIEQKLYIKRLDSDFFNDDF